MNSKDWMFLTPGTRRQQCPPISRDKDQIHWAPGSRGHPSLLCEDKTNRERKYYWRGLIPGLFTKVYKRSGGSGPRLTPSDGPCFRDREPTKGIPLHSLDWQSRLYTFLLLHKHMATLPCVFWVHSRSHEQKYSTSLVCSSIKKLLLTRTDVVSLIQKTVYDNQFTMMRTTRLSLFTCIS